MTSILSAVFWNAKGTEDMFVMAVPILEKMIRPVLVYFFLIIALRVFGKRELTNLNPFDFVVLLTLSNTVQNAIIGEDNTILGGVIGATTLLLTNYLVVRFLFGHRRLDQIMEGEPTTLIEDGKIIPKALAHEMLTEAELTTVAHRQGFSGISEIEKCVLEPGGNFYVVGKTPGTDSVRHDAIMAKLEELTREINKLKSGKAD